jgi:hypothetical protein
VREALVVLVSAVVVVAGVAASRGGGAPVALPPASAAVIDEPAPLPSGAASNWLEALPVDDERSLGCHFADHGFGDYGGWRRMPLGRALIPTGGGLSSTGSFRLLVHFHGAEPIRKQLAPEGLGLVIVGVDAGVGSHAYERALDDPSVFEKLVHAVEAEVAAVTGRTDARADPILLSSWSAGYGAIGRVLARPHDNVQAVVLLDSLYGGYLPGKQVLEHGQVAPFVEAARAASLGGPLIYLTHTDIQTPGYASTSEVATFLLGELGAATVPVEGPAATEPFPLKRMYEAARLVVRGYGGDGRDAHCAQLHLLPTILRETVLPSLRR